MVVVGEFQQTVIDEVLGVLKTIQAMTRREIFQIDALAGTKRQQSRSRCSGCLRRAILLHRHMSLV